MCVFIELLRVGSLVLRFKSTAGLNEHGLSCDAQTLNELWSQYPVRKRNVSELSQDVLCVWALANFKSTPQVVRAMKKVNIWKGYIDGIPGLGPGGEHYTFRDKYGNAVVIEFLDGKAVVMNETLGVVTNQPNYDWHKRNVKHLKWKMKRNRAAVALPGGYYPDDRLLRIYMLLEGLPAPKSYREAFMQTAHVLNSVIVPPGDFPGTDSPEGQKGGGPTLFSFIYDHNNAKLFWTDTMNQNWQLLDLHKMSLGAGAEPIEFNFNEDSNGWFNDMTKSIIPAKRQKLLVSRQNA